MNLPNTPKYHPDLEKNVSATPQSQKNFQEIYAMLDNLDKNAEKNDDFPQGLVAEIREKIAFLQKNNEAIPTAIVNMMEKIAKNQQPSTIARETISRILV